MLRTPSSRPTASTPFLLLLLISALTSCLSSGGGSSDCERGDEGCECYPNDTCNGDLACYSGLCVEDETDADSTDESANVGTDDTANAGTDDTGAPDGTDGSSSSGTDTQSASTDPANPSSSGTDPSGSDPSETDSSGGGQSSTPSNSSGADPETPVGIHGQLRVQGTQLVNETGNVVQLKGASSMWLNWEPTGYAESLEGVRYMRDEWNLQIIRAAMGVDEDGAYLENPDKARQQVATIVENAIELGIYVLIDWHDHAAELHQAEAVAFFSDMAETYGDVPNVLYETYNEPLDVSWTGTLKPYHEAVSAAIRQHDPDNVIVLGTPNWSQDVDVAAASPVAGSNLMYTLHFYACTHGAELRAKGQDALNRGLPLFVTEWGAADADGGLDGIVCESDAASWHDWMDANAISWTAWKLDGCEDSTCFFVDRNVSTQGGWTSSDLNGHAPFVIQHMQQNPTAVSQGPAEPSSEPTPSTGSCTPSGMCATGDGQDCVDGEAVARDCSACTLLWCGSDCCSNVGYFGAVSRPDFLIREDLVNSYEASSTEATLNMSFDFGAGDYEQIGVIAFALDQPYAIDPANLAIMVSSTSDIEVSLENGDAGCAYYTYTSDGVAFLYEDASSPYVCWGDFTPGSMVRQINVRIVGYTSGSEQLAVSYVGW